MKRFPGALAMTAGALLLGASLARAQFGAVVDIVPPVVPDAPVRIVGLGAPDLIGLEHTPDAAWPKIFAVFVDSEEELPPMLGEWKVDAGGGEGEILFTPRFPFVPGQSYRVEFKLKDHEHTATFVLEAPVSTPSVKVERVYPTADVLPENLLRFYVYFSGPMRGGDVASAITLEDADGNPVEGAFVETIPELWDPDRRRVTVICHPGRIKQGLALHEREGPPLKSGQTFRLVVASSMRAEDGEPLKMGFTKTFQVADADRTSPNPRDWTLSVPGAESRDPLEIKLDEALDHALLPRFLSVRASDGSVIEGALTVTGGEASCFFVPSRPWIKSTYHLEMYPALEDLAGNRLDRPFDTRGASEVKESASYRIAFSIPSKP